LDDPFEKAVAAHNAGDYEAALAGYRAAGPLKNARHNLGALLSQLGRPDEAEAALRPIVRQFPDFAPSRFSLALALLAQGRYAEGWALYEARRELGNPGIFAPDGPTPEWRGEPIAGKRIVVCAEQGYGDQIMFARYLEPLGAAGAEVVVGCNRVIGPLFAGAGLPIAPFTARHRALPPCDYWVLEGSLPLRLGLPEPPPPPRLTAAPRGGEGIGVVPTGSALAQGRRALPGAFTERLLALGRDLRPEATGARNFRQTAEIVAGLDLVISIDTAIAHLAAALGVETWILLPAFGADWRWARDPARSPWYDQVRLIRQPSPDAWGPLLAEVEARLSSRPGRPSRAASDRETGVRLQGVRRSAAPRRNQRFFRP
jgi:tetratricopeptide (TPR) repeat protein